MRADDIELARDGRSLVIVTNGRRRELSASLLWAECPSAQGRVRRQRGEHRVPPASLAIMAVREIGTYGVNIAFSDGHDRGIYPWVYLNELAARPQLADFLHT